jgi:hypothetical protein
VCHVLGPRKVLSERVLICDAAELRHQHNINHGSLEKRGKGRIVDVGSEESPKGKYKWSHKLRITMVSLNLQIICAFLPLQG